MICISRLLLCQSNGHGKTVELLIFALGTDNDNTQSKCTNLKTLIKDLIVITSCGNDSIISLVIYKINMVKELINKTLAANRDI